MLWFLLWPSPFLLSYYYICLSMPEPNTGKNQKKGGKVNFSIEVWKVWPMFSYLRWDTTLLWQNHVAKENRKRTSAAFPPTRSHPPIGLFPNTHRLWTHECGSSLMGFRTNLHDTITSQGPVSERCCTGDQTSNAQVFLKDTPDSNHNSF